VVQPFPLWSRPAATRRRAQRRARTVRRAAARSSGRGRVL